MDFDFDFVIGLFFIGLITNICITLYSVWCVKEYIDKKIEGVK